MISNNTPAAAPTNVVNSEQQALRLFGPASTSQTSQQFNVDQHSFFLSAYNLGTDDVITVQQVVYQGASQLVSDYQPVYGPVVLDKNRSKARIDHPGRYQLHHTGSSSLGTFTVLGAGFVMTTDGVAELAQGLIAVIKNSNLTVTGTSPIVITGTGIPSDPYDVTIPNVQTNSGGTSSATGNNSVAIGKSASARGAATVAVGYLAGTGGDGSGGDANTVYVGEALVDSGSPLVGNSVFIGNTAVTPAVGSNFNVAVGYSAAYHAAGLTQATVVGGDAADGALDGTNITAIGCKAGFQATHSGVYIGAMAGYQNPYTHNIIINDDQGLQLDASQNDQIVLGGATQTQLVTAGSIIQGGVISASDERLKTDIENEVGALDKLSKLSPVTFNWDKDAVKKFRAVLNESEYQRKQHGLIAQELDDVFPEVVETVDRGGGAYKMVHYDRLVPILLAAINELNAKLEALENSK